MQQPIPEIKIQSVSQVEDSIHEKKRGHVFNSTTYSGLNRLPQLRAMSPPVEFYEANGDTSNKTFYYTAMEEISSLEDEDEPPYIDLDKDFKLTSFQNKSNTFYDTAPKFPQTVDASSPFPQSPFQFTTPQASSTKRFNVDSLSDDMSTIHIELTEVEELVSDPFFSCTLSDMIEGVPVESEDDYKKHSLIELFDRLCMKEQEHFRKLMQTKGGTDDLAKIDLETLDYETTFVDLSAETREHPPNAVSTAINCLTRAEIKNDIYRTMTKDMTGKLKFNLGSERKDTAFIPETQGNIEILTYLGSTSRASTSSSGARSEPMPQFDDTIFNEMFAESFNHSSAAPNLDESSFGPRSDTPMSRWENFSNLAGLP